MHIYIYIYIHIYIQSRTCVAAMHRNSRAREVRRRAHDVTVTHRRKKNKMQSALMHYGDTVPAMTSARVLPKQMQYMLK